MNSQINKILYSKNFKSILAIFLSIVLVCTLSAFPKDVAYAAESKTIVSSASKGSRADKTSEAASKTSDVVNASGSVQFLDVLQGINSFTSTIYYILSGTNIVLDWLGYGSDSSLQSLCMKMYQEIQDMHNQLNQLNSKVDNLINQLTQFRAETSFNNRITKASEYKNRWNTFENDFIDNGMENLLSTYDWKVREGWEKWCKNENDKSRNDCGIDNSGNIFLIYQFEPGSETDAHLYLTKDNFNYDELYDQYFKAHGWRYVYQHTEEEIIEHEKSNPYFNFICIPKEDLPEGYSDWDFNTYKDRFKSEFSKKLKTDFDNDLESAGISGCMHEGSYIYDQWKMKDCKYSNEEQQQIIDRIAKDTMDVLSYRIGAIEVNNDNSFTKDVINKFNNYSTNLTGKTEQGLDALLQSIFLTNAFEGEARDSINSYCAMLALKTSIYATFALDVIEKSNMASKSEEDEGSDLMKVTNNWLKSINVISAGQQNGITGHNDYCYITNTRVQVLPVNAYFRFSYKTDSSGNKNKGGYQVELSELIPQISFILDGEVVYDENGNWYTKNFIPLYVGKYDKDVYTSMIGEQNSILVDYYYLAKGQEESFNAYLSKNSTCADGSNTDLSKLEGNLILSIDKNLQEMTDSDSSLNMYEEWYHYGSRGWPEVSGSRTDTWGNIKNSSYDFNKKMTANILDTNTGQVNSNKTLVAYCKSNKNDNSNFLRQATFGWSCYQKLNLPSGRNSCVALSSKNYVLVKEDVNSKLNAPNSILKGSYVEADYDPLSLLQQNQDLTNKSGTIMGAGDVILLVVLSFIGGSAVTAAIVYAVLRKKKFLSNKK